jgi:hypothetical protein
MTFKNISKKFNMSFKKCKIWSYAKSIDKIENHTMPSLYVDNSLRNFFPIFSSESDWASYSAFFDSYIEFLFGNFLSQSTQLDWLYNVDVYQYTK